MDELDLFRSGSPADGRGAAGGSGDLPRAAYLRYSRDRTDHRTRRAEADTADLPRIPAGPVLPPPVPPPGVRPAPVDPAPVDPASARRCRRPRFRAVLVTGAAGAGFAAALALQALGPYGTGDRAPSAGPPASASPVPGPEAELPEGGGAAGVLRPGDSGPGVVDLQNRLSRIPDVYTDGERDGRYDAVLAEAVARFQLWYGIRGDEDGIYGDDTRRGLEART